MLPHLSKLKTFYNIILSLKEQDFLERCYKYLIIIFILGVPLYPKFPVFSVPGTFVAIRAEDLLFILTLGLFIVIYGKNLIFPKNRIIKSVYLYLIAGFLSLLSAIFISQTVVLHIGLLHWLRRVEYMSPLLFAYYFIKNKPDELKFFAKLIFIVVIYAFLFGLGQRYLNWPIIITQNEEYSKGIALRWITGSHINSTFAGHYDLATYLILVLPFSVAVFSTTKDKLLKIISATVYFSGMWLLINAASRISIVSYLLSLFIVMFLIRKYKELILAALISLVIIGFSSNLLLRYGRIFTVLKDKVTFNVQFLDHEVLASDNFLPPKKAVETPTPTPIPVFEDRSTSIRLNVEWPRAFRAFTKNPLFGTGFSSITLATDNDYLRMLGETGLLGFLSFMLLIAEIFLLIIKKFKLLADKLTFENIFILAIFASVPGIMLNAVFIDIFEASKFALSFWLMMGLGIGFLDSERMNG